MGRSPSPNKSSILMRDFPIFLLLYNSFTSFSSLALSFLNYAQFKRKCSGVSFTLQNVHSGWVSGSILLLCPFNMECPVFSLIIFVIPFLEVFFRRIDLFAKFCWVIFGTIFLYLC